MLLPAIGPLQSAPKWLCMLAQKIQLRRKLALPRDALFHAIIWATPRRKDMSSAGVSSVTDLRTAWAAAGWAPKCTKAGQE